jgi:hypothetical protein
VLAAGGPPEGRGGGKGGGETSLLNNLSIPAKFINAAAGETPPPGLTYVCGSYPNFVNEPPTGPLSTGWPIDTAVYYWVQKTAAKWTADCSSGAPITLYAQGDWGDNLIGDAPLSAGRPIRVEMTLQEVVDSAGSAPVNGSGYPVAKLEPAKLDRLSAYGVPCVSNCSDTAGAPETDPAMQFRIFDPTAELKIEQTSPTSKIYYNNLVGAEINASGGVVYGLNWGTRGGSAEAATAGLYTLKFQTKKTLQGGFVDGSTCEPDVGFSGCWTIDIEVTQGGGGGGQGGRT